MSIGAHQSRSREGQNERPSRFATILHRIDLMRENCDWHRPGPSSTIAKRRRRILSAQSNMVERLAAYISAVRSPRPQPRTRRLWIAVLLLIVFLVAVLALLFPSRSEELIWEQFTLPLPITSRFLSEPDAMIKARE